MQMEQSIVSCQGPAVSDQVAYTGSLGRGGAVFLVD